jgi:REP element-mobilizing transposase RayT
MPLYPMGFHVTWGTYGARLTGGDRPFVDRWHNEYGAPLPRADPARQDAARDRMKEDPVHLTIEQRQAVEHAVRELARRYRWPLHAMAAQSDHTHVVVAAARDGEQLRDALKATATRLLNQMFERRTWWAEGGSAKYLWERKYFDNTVRYVNGQRDF